MAGYSYNRSRYHTKNSEPGDSAREMVQQIFRLKDKVRELEAERNRWKNVAETLASKFSNVTEAAHEYEHQLAYERAIKDE